jgi:hypothetical protein
MLPHHEETLTKMFNTPERRKQCREAWWTKVNLRTHIKSESKERWNNHIRFMRTAEVKQVWQEVGGHVHRMPSWHRMYLRDNVDRKHVIRFFVLLMKNKAYRYHHDLGEILSDEEYQQRMHIASMSLSDLVQRFPNEFLQSTSEYPETFTYPKYPETCADST